LSNVKGLLESVKTTLLHFFSAPNQMEVARQLRPLTLEDAQTSWEKLKDFDCSDAAKERFSRIGLDCLDYFFLHHRIKAKTKRHISFHQALKDKEIMDYVDSKISKIKDKNPIFLSKEELLRQRYSVFQLYYGTINQFRPTEVKRLLCVLKPTVGVLDFSAGWGGRCLGTMAYGLPYIGIDANTNMKSSYTKMIKFVNPEKPVQMFFQPSETVDFSKFNYDLIFTSPPYFMLEEYERMPQYGSEQGFLNKFFKPVVQNAWKHLKPGGHMALNMPKAMYDGVKHLLPPLTKRLRLPISGRHPSNAAAGRAIGEKDTATRTEGIYVWKKGAGRGKTRKVKK
jgi:hypothetical protein